MVAVNRLAVFVRRFVRARRHGVRFGGIARTRLPSRMRFGGAWRDIALPPDDPMLVPDFVNVVLDDDYGLRSLRNAPQTIVDIGANVGFFSTFARHCFPEATIHAYEPSRETAAYARSNTAHAGTTLFDEGVAASPGCATMRALGSSTLARTEPAETGEVRLTSLADVVERIGGQVDLLKIDCEGAEWDITANPAPFAQVRAIRMEYHLVGGRTLADVQRLAESIGFEVRKLVPNQGFGIAWLDRA
jgi:FkbM family methyltransferase